MYDNIGGLPLEGTPTEWLPAPWTLCNTLLGMYLRILQEILRWWGI